MKKLLSVLLLLATLCSTALASELRLYRISPKYEPGCVLFAGEHPDVTFQSSGDDYQTTEDMLSQMNLGLFHNDVFKMSGGNIDPRRIMAAGHCLDLSGSEVIAGLVGRMLPQIAAQVTLDGRILGIPYGIDFSYTTVDSGWATAGFTDADIPRTYPELLDFLDQWVREDRGSVTVCNQWEPSLYGPGSYTAWLTGELLSAYLLERSFAGKPLVFEEAELLPLLARTREIGEALYRHAPQPNGAYELFVPGDGWPLSPDERVVSFRLSDEQPLLIHADFSILSASAATEHPEAAIALLEDVLLNLDEANAAFFYPDAQPVRDSFAVSEAARVARDIEDWQEQLASDALAADERSRLEQSMAIYEDYLAQLEAREYAVSPRQLTSYRQHLDQVAIDRSHALSRNTPAGWEIYQLEQRFAQGELTPEALLQALNRLAQP